MNKSVMHFDNYQLEFVISKPLYFKNEPDDSICYTAYFDNGLIFVYTFKVGIYVINPN